MKYLSEYLIFLFFIALTSFNGLLALNETQATQSIHLAVHSGDIELIRSILEGGADIESKDSDSNTAIHIAFIHQNRKAIILLTDFGANINVELTFLKDPFVHGHPGALLGLLRKVKNPNSPYSEPVLHQDMRLKLDYAIVERHLSALKSYGTSANGIDKFGQTALDLTLVRRDISGALFLLSKGADPSLGLYNSLRLTSRVPAFRQRIVDNQLSVYEEIFKISHIKYYYIIRQLVPKDIFLCIICFWLDLRF